MKKIISLRATNREIVDFCNEIAKMDINCSVESKTVYSEEEDINTFRIKIYGYDKDKLIEDYRTVMTLINKIHKRYHPDPRGYYEFQLSELKYPISKDLILETLDMLNIDYRYSEDSGSIKCKLSYEEFNKILEELSRIHSDPRLSTMKIGSKPVKNLIILLSYLTKRDVEDIVEECIEQGFFRVEEDGTIQLNRDPKLIKEYYLKEGEDGPIREDNK